MRPEEQNIIDGWGWRPSQATPCPRVVAGRRCHAHRGADPCACEVLHRVLDHPRMWLHVDNSRFLTAEPYSLGDGDIRALLVTCHDLGLEFTVSGFSPYNPGRTFMLVLWPTTPGAT